MQLHPDLPLRVLRDDVLEEQDPELADVGVGLRRNGRDRAGRHGQLEVRVLCLAVEKARLAVDQREAEIALDVGELHAHFGGGSQVRGGFAGGLAGLEETLQDHVRGLGGLLGRHARRKLCALL